MVNPITTQCPFKTRIANQFRQLISRIGRSKVHIAKSKFHKNFQTKHQKGRREPFNLQERVHIEIKKLLQEEHIENLIYVPTNISFLQSFLRLKEIKQ